MSGPPPRQVPARPIDLTKAQLVKQREEDGSNHFTRLVAPFLAGFSLPTIGQLATRPAEPWRDFALAFFVAAAGLLLAGFQLSVGSLSKETYSQRFSGPIAFAGVGALTAGLVLLIWNTPGLSQWWPVKAALLILIVGVFAPIGWRMYNSSPGKWLTRRKEAP